MRWIGVAIVFLGICIYLSAATFQQWITAKAVLIQLVDADKVISEPFKAIVPEGTDFLKGNGKQGAQFLKMSKLHVPLSQYDRIFALSKAASFCTIGLGVVGFMFESWRRKTAKILDAS